MNHYAPRRREHDMRWDYTASNGRDGAHAVGYCRRHREFVADGAIFTEESAAQANAATAPFKDKYHTGGHATDVEACDCYREYLLDQRLILKEAPKDPHALHRCAVCGEYTAGVAELQLQMWFLCDEHRIRAEVEKLFEPGMREVWSSM